MFIFHQFSMQFMDLYTKFGNVDEMTQNAATTLLFVTTSIRMVNFYWNRMRYVNIINTLHDGLIHMMSSQDEQAKLIIASEMRYMKRLTKAFWICALITGNLMCFHSAIQSFFYSPVIEFDVSEVN